MRSSPPPLIATWLLKHFGCDPMNESLIGDLTEHYRQGRSRPWYWRQVSVALGTGLLQEIRNHKLLAVRAVITGWIALLLFWFLLASPLLDFLIPGLLSWWGGVFHLSGPIRNAGQWVMLCAVNTAAGWSVARLNPIHRTAMVMIFLGSFFLCNLLSFSMLVLRVSAHPLYRSVLLNYLAAIILETSGILLGGGLLIGRGAGDSAHARRALI